MGNDGNFAWEPRPGVVVRRAHPGDARQLAPWLRAADKKEIRLASGGPPIRSLLNGVEGAELCFALVADGRCEAMFGVTRQTRRFGVLWLLGSPWLAKHPRILLEGARTFLPILGRKFEVLGNMIWSGQHAYIKFLDRLGFEFRQHEEFPKEFLLFTKEVKEHV